MPLTIVVAHVCTEPVIWPIAEMMVRLSIWAEQTSKGLMWRDLGLDDWLFDFDQETEVARLPAAVLAMAKDPAGARAKAAHARAKAAELHRGMAGQVARAAS